MKARPFVEKAWDGALREIGRAPEQRAARRLGPVARGDGKRVLFLTPRAWAAHVHWEAMLGRALSARGASVEYVTCGGGRSICDRTHLYEGPPMPCRSCTGYTHRSLDAHGHRWQPLKLGRDAAEPTWPELDVLDVEGLREVTRDGVPLGRLLEVPLKWYLCNTDLERDALAALTYRRFLRSGAVILEDLARAVECHVPDTVIMLNGLFLFEQIARVVCESKGIDVVTYERGYVRDTLFFERGGAASRYDTTARWERERERPLRPDEEAELDSYLAARMTGDRSISDFWPAPRFDEPDPGFTVLFTNVTWDTAVQERDRCFGSSREWLVETIAWFASRPEQRLVVRAHPAEVRTPQAWSREPVAAVVARAFPSLPGNVKLIDASDPTSSYPLMSAADMALVYTSTAGMESVLRGTPCIAAATTQFGQKGFTYDPPDAASYFELLARAVQEPLAADVETARRYAHFFFFRVPFRTERWAWEPVPGLVRITDDRRRLEPGGDPEIDALCEGILGAGPITR